jgi:hypothetical protein
LEDSSLYTVLSAVVLPCLCSEPLLPPFGCFYAEENRVEWACARMVLVGLGCSLPSMLKALGLIPAPKKKRQKKKKKKRMVLVARLGAV